MDVQLNNWGRLDAADKAAYVLEAAERNWLERRDYVSELTSSLALAAYYYKPELANEITPANIRDLLIEAIDQIADMREDILALQQAIRWQATMLGTPIWCVRNQIASLALDKRSASEEDKPLIQLRIRALAWIQKNLKRTQRRLQGITNV